MLTHLLLLDLGFHHLVLGRGRFLVGDELLSVCQPAQQRLQGVLELPAVQQGLLQLSHSLGHLNPKNNPTAESGTGTRASAPCPDPLLPPDPRKSRDSPSPRSHLLVEGVPAGVDFFHVMLQPLDITVFPGALDESLTNSIDLLQL